VKGIKHGACDYLVKPVRLEQLRGIWKHVVKNSKTDHAVRKLPSGDGDKVEKVGANHTKKYSRKNKKVMDVADEANENTSTQKKQRVQWLVSYTGSLYKLSIRLAWTVSSHFMALSINNCSVKSVSLNKYFVAVNAGAVPKKILEVMNVEGLTRENVASHLQVWFSTLMLDRYACVTINYIIVKDIHTKL